MGESINKTIGACPMENKIRDIKIKDAYLQPLDIIPVKGGDVLRLLAPHAPLLPDFPAGIGEIYFSEIMPQTVKAWKMHVRQTQLLSVPAGQIRIVLYDMRAASPTLRVMDVMNLGRPDAYNLLKIPPGVWYGFKAISSGPAVICNCPDIPHDAADCERAPWDTPDIPYNWE